MNSPIALKTPSSTAGHIKRLGFLFFLTPALLPWIGVALWQGLGSPSLFAFFTVFYVYGLIPLLDFIVGKDPINLDRQAFDKLSEDRFYRRLTFVCVPTIIGSLLLGGYGLTAFAELGPVGQFGWIVSHGVIASSLGINAAHELIHKNTRLEQRLGGILLALVCYPGFQIEHLRGHHVHVSTPADRSSSRFGQSLYHFLPRAIAYNLLAAWRLSTNV